MAQGKYFILRSRLNGLVLDINGGSIDPGTTLTTWNANEMGSNENQLWYEHHGTETIRSKLHDFCLDLEDNRFVVNPYSPGKENQRWMLAGDRIQHRENSSLVMDIADGNAEAGAEVIAYEFGGGDNQLWEPDFEPPRYFYIQSMMNDFAVDIRASNTDPGADIIMYCCNEECTPNQLWYENRDGCISSKLNDFAADSSSGRLKLEPYDSGNFNQQWVFNEDRIQNKYNPNQVWDIVGASTDEGAELCTYEFHGNDNQLFKIRYV